MTELDLVSACIKNDKIAKKQFFDLFYTKLSYISLRYCKNAKQAEEVFLHGFSHVFSQLNNYKSQNKLNLETYVKTEFINCIVQYIKEIRSEYYVASTVRAQENKETTYDLFLDSKYIDLNDVNQSVLLKSIQTLVPSQRLIFNLQVIDNYDLESTSDMLDTSEQSIKSNLEKARFNLQKAIETILKHSNDEQPV